MVLQTFIVFEGLDGSGTSTQINLLKDALTKSLGSDKIFITSEPTENETGLFLRRMLKAQFCVNEKTSAYLFAADRCEHIYGKDGIEDQCQNGKIVVSDRYLFSSLAYQNKIFDLTYNLNKDFPLPKYLFFFEIEPEKSLKRVIKRCQENGEQTEIFEKIEIQKKTYEAYQKVLSIYENSESEMQIIRVDASKSVEEIHKFILNVLQNMPIFKR